MRKPDPDCLHCKLIDTIMKHGKKHHDDAHDGAIIGALATVIADVLSVHDQKEHIVMRKFMDKCIADKVALNLEHGIGQPRTLHS